MAWRGSTLFAFGIPGPREIVLVGLVVMALYGRNGARLLMHTPYGRSLQPWLRLLGVGSRPATSARATPTATATTTTTASRRAGGRSADRSQPTPTAPGPRRRHGRLFWALTITAAAALAAWVATRVVILSGVSPR